MGIYTRVVGDLEGASGAILLFKAKIRGRLGFFILNPHANPTFEAFKDMLPDEVRKQVEELAKQRAVLSKKTLKAVLDELRPKCRAVALNGALPLWFAFAAGILHCYGLSYEPREGVYRGIDFEAPGEVIEVNADELHEEIRKSAVEIVVFTQ